MTFLFDLIILALVCFCAYYGWEVGIWTASIAALECFACLALAVLLHEPVGGFLTPWLSAVTADYAENFALLFAFVGFAWVPFAVIRYRFHKVESADLEHVEIDPLSDRIGGVIAGGIGGAIFVGGVLITVSMTPFLAPLKPSGDRLMFDPGKLALRVAGHFLTERPDGYEGLPLPVHGGPVSTKKDMRAILTCEPWVDVDDDAAFTEEKDRYRDVDGDQNYTKDLYAVDVDRTGKRRIGFVDKYVAGSWGSQLMAPVRKRTDIKQTDPKSKKDKKKGTEETPVEEKPIETDF